MSCRCPRLAPRSIWPGLFLLPLALPAVADSGINDKTLSQSFELRAVIVPGCLLGGGSSDVTSFGSISFGQVSTLSSNLDVVSTPGGGSIVLQCSPGTPFTLSLNAGNNASGVGSGRFLAKGSEKLRYQLYQDAGYSIVWGNGSNGGANISTTFPSSGNSLTYPVYARLFSVSPMPSAGFYADTVTVTLSY